MLANAHRSQGALLKMSLSIIEPYTGRKTTWLPFICFLFLIILGTAEAQCEFWLSFTARLQPP